MDAELLVFKNDLEKVKTKSEAQIEKDCDKIKSNRKQMIYEIEAFEKKLLATMPTNDLEAELAKKLTKSVDELEKELVSRTNNNVNTQKDSFDLEHAMNSSIYKFDCSIKHRSCFVYS